MIQVPVFVEVDSHSFELFSFDVAYEAVVFVVVFYVFLLSSHVRKGVDNDPRNDGCDDQIDEEDISEVPYFIRPWNWSQFVFFSSDRRTRESVVNVDSKTV